MKKMNHTDYPKRLKTLSTSSLKYIARDAREAMNAMPDSENASYYADEIAYVANELARRNASSLPSSLMSWDDFEDFLIAGQGVDVYVAAAWNRRANRNATDSEIESLNNHHGDLIQEEAHNQRV